MNKNTHTTKNDNTIKRHRRTKVDPVDLISQINLVTEIGKQLVLINNLDELYLITVGLIQSELNYDFVSIWVVDADNKTIELKAASDSMTGIYEVVKLRSDVGSNLVVRTWQTGTACLVSNLSEEMPRYSYGTNYAPGSVYALPILNLNDTIAVLEIHRQAINSFHFIDTFVTGILVNQIAAALRNAVLFDDLQKAREEAEIANQLKSRFLASMSRSLRNPLNAILHWSEFMIDGFMGKLNAEQISTLKMIVSSGGHLLNLLNDGLDISKVKIGQGELFVEDVDLTSILFNARSVVLDITRKKSVRVKTDIAHDIPKISGEQRRLNQIFLYLLTYVARQLKDGTITICAYHKADSVFVLVTVSSTSMRLEDYIETFENIGQEDDSESGFGLSMTKHNVLLHGGQVWLERESDTDVSICVTLKGIFDDTKQQIRNHQ